MTQTTQGPQTGTKIPANVYYHDGIFFNAETRERLAEAFRLQWFPLRDKFPTHVGAAHALKLMAPAEQFHDDVFVGIITKGATLPSNNVRYDLDPVLAQDQLDKQSAKYEAQRIAAMEKQAVLGAEYAADIAAGHTKKWTRPPDTPEVMDTIYRRFIEQEKNLYATVRIIERPTPGKRFILVYGDTDDSSVTHGTGPFESLERAAAWYLHGGR